MTDRVPLPPAASHTPPTASSLRGVVIAVLGVVAISPDALLIRLVELDPWTIMAVRGLLTAGVLILLVAVYARRTDQTLWAVMRSSPRIGFIVAATSAMANILFVLSITSTHVASTLVILSATPLMAAVVGRLMFSERVSAETWFASVVAVVALGAIFSQGLGHGVGNLAAFGAAVCLSINLTIIRRHGSILLLPPLALSGVLMTLSVGWWADFGAVTTGDLGLLAINGMVIIPLGIVFQWTALRHITAPEVALIYLLEIVLGPLWVWMVLAEVPPTTTVVAGLTLVVTLVIHTGSQAMRSRRVRARTAVP